MGAPISIRLIGEMEVGSPKLLFENGKVWDEKVTVSLENELTDYSRYLDAWQLIEE